MNNRSSAQDFRHSENVGVYLRAMFKRLNEKKIRYCVLHSYEQLPDFAPSDVDIAVDLDGMQNVEPIIYELAKDLGFKVIQKLYYDVPISFYYVLFFRDGNGLPGFIQLDLMCDAQGIGSYLMDTETLLEGRRKEREFYIPSASVEACYLLIKKATKEVLLPEHIGQLRKLIKEDPEGCKRLFTCYFGRRNIACIERLIADQKVQEQFKLLNFLKREAIKRKLISKPHLIILKAFWSLKRIYQRIVQPTGFMVTLISPDGGGKSALSKQLMARLRCGFRRTTKIHWRPYILPPPHKLLRPRQWKEPESPNYEPHTLPPKGRFISAIRFLYYLSDYMVGFLPKILWPKIRTTLVITERYYYDFLIDMARFRLNLPSYLPRLFLTLVPKPDLVILLDGPPEVFYERKQEISLQEINRQLGVLKSLSTLFPNVHEVRVDQPFDKEVAEVEDLIMNELEKRLKKRLGR